MAKEEEKKQAEEAKRAEEAKKQAIYEKEQSEKRDKENRRLEIISKNKEKISALEKEIVRICEKKR